MSRPVTIYKRVSHIDQVKDGSSLPAQEAKLRAWCLANGHEVAGCYADEGISGGSILNRPGLKRALDEVTKRRGILAVVSLSRLARSTKDAIEVADRLKRAGCELVSLAERIESGTAIGAFFFTLVSALAELEKSMTSERVKGVMTHLRGQNRRISRFCPFGFTFGPDKQLLPCPAEQDHLRTIRAMHAEGFSMSAIAESLNAKGIKPKRAKAWSKSGVHSVLHREVTK